MLVWQKKILTLSIKAGKVYIYTPQTLLLDHFQLLHHRKRLVIWVRLCDVVSYVIDYVSSVIDSVSSVIDSVSYVIESVLYFVDFASYVIESVLYIIGSVSYVTHVL